MTQTQTIQAAQPVRRVYVDAMKGLGIILVVWGHFEEYYRGTSPLFNGTFECIYMFHMALFCMASGLVGKLNLKKFIGQQVWLYLISQALMMAFRVVVMQEDLAAGAGGLVGALLLPWRHMWYLYALLFWELTVPLLSLLRKKLGLAGGLLGLGAAVAVGLLAGRVEWPFALGRVFSFYPFYAIGVLFRPELDRWFKATGKSLPVRVILTGAAAAVYGTWLYKIFRLPEPVYEGPTIFHDAAYGAAYQMADRSLFYLVGTLTALALITILGGSKTLAGLGKRTLPVYILHMPVLAFLQQLGTFEPPNTHGAWAVAGWVLLTAGGAVCFLSAKPVCAVCTGVANLWYKTLPGLIARIGGGDGRKEPPDAGQA